ncbi:Glyoxylase, beta-lactamase superfamily II [Marinilactibacillus piezotolerans]|uniref:Glyoxylase, beta-lactamase superfamily II n=1 Tax=Marinilactibacillus piezotolerans TaxID=258723 RepID=A0A1I3VUL8_9LACT|nr:MBL fold metallo-hydrolase [Marinilactibacillus piezotolerans]SFJ98829.1 Glyoxylase, beta-lactamase superfamily II [Marinilactibacillus piezotolerans]
MVLELDSMDFHDMTLTWINGGITSMDGGAMFGPVPKPLWSKKYPVNEKNQIELPTDAILIQYQGKNYLIDAGVGRGKLTEKQIRNYGVREETQAEESLAQLGITTNDIDMVLMTHMHFDHAGGLTQLIKDKYVSTFPNAIIYVNNVEWNEIRHPNIRSKSTYWKENWEVIQDQVRTFDDHITVVPGIELFHTGGHSKGHSIVKLTQQRETLLHMADIMPTHAHQNPLWVLGFDDYPMDSIAAKQHWMKEAVETNAKFIFYHDAFYRMIQWDTTGKNVISSLKRTKLPYINWSPENETIDRGSLKG